MEKNRYRTDDRQSYGRDRKETGGRGFGYNRDDRSRKPSFSGFKGGGDSRSFSRSDKPAPSAPPPAPISKESIQHVKDLMNLIAASEFAEVSIEIGNIKLKASKERGARSVDTVVKEPQLAASRPTEKANVEEEEKPLNVIAIEAPMVGTFYQSPKPGEPPFVQVGDTVTVGQVICIIEAMKLFNEIEAEQSGTIVELLVEDGVPVEYGQPLFRIEPA